MAARPLAFAMIASLLLQLPGAAAGPDGPLLDATGTGLSVAGDARLYGRLISFRSLDAPPGPPIPTSEPSFARTPTSFNGGGRVLAIHVVTHNGTSVAGASSDGEVGFWQRHLEDASWSISRPTQGIAEPTTAFFMAPIPGHVPPAVTITASTAELTVAPDSRDKAVQHIATSTQDVRKGSLAGATSEVSEGWTQLRIEGDFRFVIWEFDVDFHANTGNLIINTGSESTSMIPATAGPISPASTFESQEAYITVEDGWAEFGFAGATDARLNIALDSLAATGTVGISQAAGHVTTPEGEHQLKGEDASISGRLRGTISETTSTGMRLSLEGEADHALVGTQRFVYPSSTIAQTAIIRGWQTAFIGVSLLLALGGAWQWRRVALNRSMSEMEAEMEVGNYDCVARQMPQNLLKSRRHRDDAQLIKTVALLRLGELGAAERGLQVWNGPLPLQHYLQAYVMALRGESVAAAKLVSKCLELDPTMGTEIRANPTLSRFATTGATPARFREGYT